MIRKIQYREWSICWRKRGWSTWPKAPTVHIAFCCFLRHARFSIHLVLQNYARNNFLFLIRDHSQYLNLVGINSQLFFYLCMETQGRSQDLNRPLKDIVQNFDDDVIVIMMTSLSWRWGKTRKVSCYLIFLRE